LSGQFDWIALSPKRFKPPREEIYCLANELKVVIGDADDLRWAEAAAQKVSANAIKLLQPQWIDQWREQNQPPAFDLVFDYVRAHAEWRVGLQAHKYLKVR
jgi:organic radical activating enzyme